LNPAAYSGSGDENLAYQFGVGVGNLGKKRSWEARGFWQHTESFALDPNLYKTVGSDILDSIMSFESFDVGSSYAFADSVSDRVNKRLPTGTGSDIGGVGTSPTDYQLPPTRPELEVLKRSPQRMKP